MKVAFISAGFLMLLLSVVQAGSLYRWVDKDGKVHYGDQPAEDAVKPVQKKYSDHDAGEVDLPYAARKAKQEFPVILYVSSNCGAICVQARAMLNKRGVPFVEKDVATKEEIDTLKKVSGGTAIPTLTVGRTPLVGFEAGQWNGELDIAGYPKIAAYGFRPATPPNKTDIPVAAEP